METEPMDIDVPEFAAAPESQGQSFWTFQGGQQGQPTFGDYVWSALPIPQEQCTPAFYGTAYPNYEKERSTVSGNIPVCKDLFDNRTKCGHQKLSGFDRDLINTCHKDGGIEMPNLVQELPQAVSGTVAQGVDMAKKAAFALFFTYMIYIILAIQVIIEIATTTGEIFGIKNSIGTKITVILLLCLQEAWAVIGIKYGVSSLVVANWVGITYYAVIMIAAVVSIILQFTKMKAKAEEESKIFNYISLVAKFIQVAVALIFGALFIFTNYNSVSNEFKLWTVAVIAGMEIVTQAISFFGLI